MPFDQFVILFFFSSRRRHTRSKRDWSSDVCSSDLNAALFHYDYRNQQFLDAFALPGGAGTGFHTVNAPKSRVDGAEFEFHAKASADLEILSSLGLMSSKYVELTLHSGEYQAPGVLRVCCVGNKLIQAPPVNASL